MLLLSVVELAPDHIRGRPVAVRACQVSPRLLEAIGKKDVNIEPEEDLTRYLGRVHPFEKIEDGMPPPSL